MKLAKSLLIVTAIIGFMTSSSFAAEAELVREGEQIFMTKGAGNCLACHAVNGKEIDGPGSLGPKLQYLSAWPEQAIYDKIYNPYTTNPISVMPAFGINGWLSDGEIKAVVAYLKTIK